MRPPFARLAIAALLVSLTAHGLGTASARAEIPTPRWQGKMGVMLQGFHWNSCQNTDARGQPKHWWNVVREKAGTISKRFDSIWLPPAAEAAVKPSQGYLPRNYLNFNSDYGTEAELRGALAALRGQKRPVKAILDVVANHTVPKWFDKNSSERFVFNPQRDSFYHLTGKDIVKEAGGQGHKDMGQQFGAVADIDHRSLNARKVIKNHVKKAQAFGFSRAVRWDYAKGLHPVIVRHYVKQTKVDFSVAEIWENYHGRTPDQHRGEMFDFIKKTKFRTAAFDFTTKALLHDAIHDGQYWKLKDSQGRPQGLIGLAPNYSVTFVDNHDTGPSPGGDGRGGQRHWELRGAEIMQGYSYILTHPGIPSVYWPHYFDWKSPFTKHKLKGELDRLMVIREQAGITSDSKVSIAAADGGRYAAFVEGNRGRIAMKIGPGAWNPNDPQNWKLLAHGRDYAVWGQRLQGSQAPELPKSWRRNRNPI